MAQAAAALVLAVCAIWIADLVSFAHLRLNRGVENIVAHQQPQLANQRPFQRRQERETRQLPTYSLVETAGSNQEATTTTEKS